MTLRQAVEAALQRLDIQCPRQAHGARQVVGQAVGLQLGEEPQALLSEGLRATGCTLASLHTEARRSVGGRQLQGLGTESAGFEGGPQRQLTLQLATNLRHQLHGQ